MICAHQDCAADAAAHVTTLFGSFDLCADHADEVCPPESRFRSKADPSLFVSRSGPGGDPIPDWLRELAA